MNEPEKNKALEKFRTRWRRWLGNKCRANKEDWTTLLDTNWMGWADGVLSDRAEASWSLHIPTGITSNREKVKAVWLAAINIATMDQLHRLDGIYATDRWHL